MQVPVTTSALAGRTQTHSKRYALGFNKFTCPSGNSTGEDEEWMHP